VSAANYEVKSSPSKERIFPGLLAVFTGFVLKLEKETVLGIFFLSMERTLICTLGWKNET
jgi:hypothetical protein